MLRGLTHLLLLPLSSPSSRSVEGSRSLSQVTLSQVTRSPRPAIMASSKILRCDAASISFPSFPFPSSSTTDSPNIADPVTLSSLTTAAKALQSDELVAFPTETVYGLGGSALASSTAVPKIYKAKGRPSDNPLIVHIASTSQLGQLVDPAFLSSASTTSPSSGSSIGTDSLPASYRALINRFWPGPLTLLFPTIPGELVSERVTCGLQTVGIRVPSHPVARALLALSGVPVAAPSANTSGRPSPTSAAHVDRDLRAREELAWILDGGECSVGLESTVVSALSDKGKGKEKAVVEGENGSSGKEILRVLRLGGVSPEDIQACLDDAGLADRVTLRMEAHAPQSSGTTENGLNGHAADAAFIPSTPGMKYKHYSPDAHVVLLRSVTNADPQHRGTTPALADVLGQHKAKRVGLLHLEGSPLSVTCHAMLPGSRAHSISLGAPHDHETQAQRLFGGLRALDEQGVDVILVEAVQERGLGRTVMERLRKSAGGREPLEVRLVS